MSVPGVPTLSADDIEAIRNNKTALANLEKSAQWYLGFLQRNDHWIKSYDHNHLRITRVIKSLKQLNSETHAENFKAVIYQTIGTRQDKIDQKARMFWNEA